MFPLSLVHSHKYYEYIIEQRGISTVETVFLKEKRRSKKEVDIMTNIPKDPVMLLSYINTQLRDFYPSMEELCAALGADKNEIDLKLDMIDYQYDPERNQYV